jgi:phosphatidylinositol glycan class C protein
VTSSPPVWELLKPEIMPQFTFYSFVALFVLVFRALLEDRIYASQLNSFNMIILFGMIVMVKWSRNIPTRVTKTFDANTTEESNRLISWLLPPFVLYICSPLLLSLTKATTSDSIWPLAGCLFLLSSVLGGFGENVGFGKVDKPGHRRRGSVGELTLKDKSQR